MLRFLMFGDLHYDEVDDGDRRIDEIMENVKEKKPDFIVSLGDLCNPVEENRKVLDKLNAVGIPLYHTIGNHETDHCQLEEIMRFLEINNPYYSVVYDDYKLIFLNTCYLSKDGIEYPYYNRNFKKEAAIYPLIPSNEIEWLQNELDDGKKYMIFSHHSLMNDFRDRGVHNREKIRELFRGKDVIACINGHDHGSAFSVVEGIPYYTLNSANYAYLNGILQYKQALCAYIEIDDKEFRISGMEGEYASVTPDEVGVNDYKWNGVSVKAQTSSHCVALNFKR